MRNTWRHLHCAVSCLLLTALLLALSACGGSGNQDRTGEPDTKPAGQPVAPGIVEKEPDLSPEKNPVQDVQPEEDIPQTENSVGTEAPPAEEPPPAEPADGGTANTVTASSTTGYSEENYEQTVMDVLTEITTEDMTKLQKARAIFDYAHDKIRYTGDSDKSDWKEGAYTGMTTKRGDCFTYYAVCRALLTAAEIDNLVVTRVGGKTSHYWNLVDCGDGWYHFDATPRSSKMPAFESFMFTDQEAADYTAAAGRNYYTFDGSLLPARADSEDDSAAVSTPVQSPEEDTPEPEAPPPQQNSQEEIPPEDAGNELPPAEDPPDTSEPVAGDQDALTEDTSQDEPDFPPEG